MNNYKLLILITIINLSGCATGYISKVPISIEEVGNVYRYEEHAIFPSQSEEIDLMMIEHCEEINGGSPVIVLLKNRQCNLGSIKMSGNGNQPENNIDISGTINIYCDQTLQQKKSKKEIYFKC